MVNTITHKGKAVIRGGQRIARNLNHNQFNTGHVLLSLLKTSTEHDRVYAILKTLDVPTADLQKEVIEQLGRGDKKSVSRILPTPDVNKMLSYAQAEAKSFGDEHIEPWHMLVALIAQGNAISRNVLSARGMTPGIIRQRSITIERHSKLNGLPTLAEIVVTGGAMSREEQRKVLLTLVSEITHDEKNPIQRHRILLLGKMIEDLFTVYQM